MGSRSVSSLPAGDGDTRPDPDFGVNGELVGEPLGSAKPQAHPFAGSVAVSHRLFDVPNAGSGILERQPHPVPGPVLNDLQTDRTTPAVIQCVACQFARG